MGCASLFLILAVIFGPIVGLYQLGRYGWKETHWGWKAATIFMLTITFCQSLSFLNYKETYNSNFNDLIPEIVLNLQIIGFFAIPVVIGFYFRGRDKKAEAARMQAEIKQQQMELAQERKRRAFIESIRAKVGDASANALINRQVMIGWTPKLVTFSWGKPARIDKQTITANGIQKERWIYDIAREGSTTQYVYFKNGKVDKLKN